MILTILPMTRLARRPDAGRGNAAFPLVGASTTLEMVRGLSHFELADRLVQVWTRNEGRIEALDAIRERIALTRRHLASSQGRVELGEAYLRRLLDKQEACLAAIRADRRLATAVVRELEARRRGRLGASATRRADVG